MAEKKKKKTNMEESSGIDYQAVFDSVMIHMHWFTISIILCIGIALFYLKTTAPTYEIWTDILIKEENTFSKSNSGGLESLSSLGLLSNSNGFDNEISILSSRSLSRRTVMNLKLYVKYAYKGFFKDTELYKNSPVTAEVSPVFLDSLDTFVNIEVTPGEDGTYSVSMACGGEEKVYKTKAFPLKVKTPYGFVSLVPNVDPSIRFEDKTLAITIMPPRIMGDIYSASISIEPTSRQTTVARLSLVDSQPERAVDYLTEMVRVYNASANELKDEVALKTETFINNRIRLIDNELGSTESNLESFKKQNQLVNFASDAEVAYRGVENYQKQQTELQTQLMLVNSLREYVENPANYMEIIPANLGITDAALNKNISDYNEQVVDRKRLLATSPETSPVIQSINTTIAALYPGIKHSLLTVYENLMVQKRNVDDQYNTYISRLGRAPTQERELLDIERQQAVKATLYEILLQKREENSISLASTADKAQIIDPAESTLFPISPKKNLVMLVALFMGVAVPGAILYVLSLTRFKIEGRNDIEKLTEIPVLADIFLSKNLKEGQRAVVVRENANGLMEETFRNLRTNLDFVISEDENEKVIMVTSMIMGEGKTFIASNLAMSMALSDRKTLLVGLDIRKPRLSKLFSLKTGHHGVTTILSSPNNSDDFLREQIFNSGINANLDILPAGAVPPNPSELIARKRLDETFARLRNLYDIIIVDTPPLGMVSDSLLLGRVADTTLVVCRCGFSLINNFTKINEYFNDKKLPKINLVLNGIDLDQRKYGYYYGYGSYGKRYGRYGSYGRYGHYGSYSYTDDKK